MFGLGFGFFSGLSLRLLSSLLYLQQSAFYSNMNVVSSSDWGGDFPESKGLD